MRITLLAMVAALTVNAEPQQPRDQLQDMFLPPELIMQNQEALALSDEQREAIHSRLQKLGPDFEQKQQALQQQFQAMQQLLRDEKIDEPKLMAQFNKILDQENEIKKMQFGLMLHIHETLSSEQRAKAQKLKQEWPQARQKLETRLRSKVEKIHAGVQALAESGTQPSDIAAIMDQFQPLMKEGKVKEAEALLDRALKLVEEKNKK